MRLRQIAIALDTGMAADGHVRVGIHQRVFIAVGVAIQRRGANAGARVYDVLAQFRVHLRTGVVPFGVEAAGAVPGQFGPVQPGKAVIGADEHGCQRKPVAGAGQNFKGDGVAESTGRGTIGRQGYTNADHIGRLRSTTQQSGRAAGIAIFGNRFNFRGGLMPHTEQVGAAAMGSYNRRREGLSRRQVLDGHFVTERFVDDGRTGNIFTLILLRNGGVICREFGVAAVKIASHYVYVARSGIVVWHRLNGQDKRANLEATRLKGNVPVLTG